MRSLAIALLAGCSFSLASGGAVDAPEGDGPTDANGADDANDIDATTVDAAPLGAWGAPQRITELATTDGEDDPSLTSDLLEIYFGSNRPGGLGNEDIWMAKRLIASDPFGIPINLATISSSDGESNIRVAPSGLVIFFSSNRSPSLNWDVWTSTRANRLAPWNAPTRVTELASSVGDYAAHPSADLLRVTFCSDRVGGDEDLFVATRTVATGVWSTPTEVTDTSTTANECDPMDPDRNNLYFASTRTGSQGAYDLYVATRPTGGTYATPIPLTVLNSTSNDRDVWVSADLRLLVFSSNRTGSDDLYFSTR